MYGLPEGVMGKNVSTGQPFFGVFGLPPQVMKIANHADRTSGHEREAARRQLWKRGWFLDRVGIIWERDKVPEMARDGFYESMKELS